MPWNLDMEQYGHFDCYKALKLAHEVNGQTHILGNTVSLDWN